MTSSAAAPNTPLAPVPTEGLEATTAPGVTRTPAPPTSGPGAAGGGGPGPGPPGAPWLWALPTLASAVTDSSTESITSMAATVHKCRFISPLCSNLPRPSITGPGSLACGMTTAWTASIWGGGGGGGVGVGNTNGETHDALGQRVCLCMFLGQGRGQPPTQPNHPPFRPLLQPETKQHGWTPPPPPHLLFPTPPLLRPGVLSGLPVSVRVPSHPFPPVPHLELAPMGAWCVFLVSIVTRVHGMGHYALRGGVGT
jgi:hypothetical protein